MAVIHFFTITIVLFSASDCFKTKKRFLAYNPADLSTALGYQNHQIHDLTSLVNEASGTAHAIGSGKNGQASYNVPNFPAMGQNQVQLQTGSLGGASVGSSPIVSGSSASGSQFSSLGGTGSASFSGTNQWRCDAHVIESCDSQCMDVDPKDGCPFCISGCHPASGGGASSFGGQGVQSNGLSQGQGTPSSGSQSGNLLQNQGTPNVVTNQSGGLSQNPGKLAGGYGQSGNLQVGQNFGTLTGTAGQSGTGLGGSLMQQPSGLAGTGGNQGTQAKQGTTGAAITASVLSQISQATNVPLSTTTLPVSTRTCAPKRCVPPCDKGIVLDSSGCPQCLCPAHV
ncbi:uncharacterized PE-PGRS family protein PE_PGRS54-like isoform X2 [Mercenaria mercenaria]|uniref:uncharacterized PE-PGRS family protein PE_PGRS54-like isoform X2 n=1 Tax=Mercenaria mercenaria TaxID=6596 RepID=UPI00234F87C6|nr:uncharacterized PE-PGRS family protein PE_PGRS54-like isoform X2 [Mercenaria mercenaria]